MKKYLLFITLAMLVIVGCKKERRLFRTVAMINNEITADVNRTGHFEHNETLSRDDILNQLDIPTDSRITGIDIEAVAVKIVLKTGNEAEQVLMSSTLNNVEMFTDFLFDLNTNQNQWIGINTLSAGGISVLKLVLESIVIYQNLQSFGISFSGDSVPNYTKMLLDATLKIRASVKIDGCVEMPTIFSFGEDCDF